MALRCDATCSDANVLQHGNIVDALSSSQVRLQELRHSVSNLHFIYPNTFATYRLFSYLHYKIYMTLHCSTCVYKVTSPVSYTVEPCSDVKSPAKATLSMPHPLNQCVYKVPLHYKQEGVLAAVYRHSKTQSFCFTIHCRCHMKRQGYSSGHDFTTIVTKAAAPMKNVLKRQHR